MTCLSLLRGLITALYLQLRSQAQAEEARRPIRLDRPCFNNSLVGPNGPCWSLVGLDYNYS